MRVIAIDDERIYSSRRSTRILAIRTRNPVAGELGSLVSTICQTWPQRHAEGPRGFLQWSYWMRLRKQVLDINTHPRPECAAGRASDQRECLIRHLLDGRLAKANLAMKKASCEACSCVFLAERKGFEPLGGN